MTTTTKPEPASDAEIEDLKRVRMAERKRPVRLSAGVDTLSAPLRNWIDDLIARIEADRAERESNNRAFVEMNAVFEAVIRAIRGEALSEFDESHGAVHEAKALRAAAQERDRQIAAQAEEIERLKGLLNALMEQHPKRRGWSEPPGHSHLVAGIWDHDNGAKAGTKCEWCAAWWAARAALKPESTGR